MQKLILSFILIKLNNGQGLVEQYPPADYSNPLEPGKHIENLRAMQREG